MSTVQEKIDHLITSGTLLKNLEEGVIRCTACAHRCLIKPGRRGICQVRFNQGGELRVPWGYVAAFRWIRLRKNRLIIFCPVRMRFRLACWAVIFTAATARIGLPHRNA